jgi:ring-1,2-phenylacetyl-CoA epoxidase subunit PaaD
VVKAPVHPDIEEVRRAVAGVPDPELPPATIGMLGMIHDVRVDDAGWVQVELLPTFAGCPATDVIGEDVESAVRKVEGVTDVAVRFRFDPPWSSDRISPEGHEALRGFGISPPSGSVPADTGVAPPPGRSSLPLAVTAPPVTCPYCGSDATEVDSPFGPTPCRSINFCTSCRQPFESFKSL